MGLDEVGIPVGAMREFTSLFALTNPQTPVTFTNSHFKLASRVPLP